MLRTAVRRLRARASGAPGDEQDAGAALLTVVLLLFVVMAMATLVLGVVVSQIKPTTATQQSTRVVFAAETGLQTALSQVRTSRSASGVGDPTALPCTVTGSVASPAGGLAFTVHLRYYTQDPAGRSDAWLAANRLAPCTGDGSGPAQATTMSTQPAFSLISATGNDTSTGALVHSRALLAQYAFSVSNRNIPGGVLWTAPDEACLQATSATVGSTVTYVPAASCASTNDLQRWAYDTGYHLVLASTTTTTTTTSGGTTTTDTSGLCITQPDLSASDRTVTLQACTLASRTPTQLWGYEAGAHFRGQNADNTNKGSNCLYAGHTWWSPGDVVMAGGPSTCDAGNDAWGSFSPDPKMGAGGASLATSQIVNYQQFGRCTDVTNGYTGSTYMILYPCKQDPTGGSNLAWNHRWYYGAETGTVAEPTGAAGMSTRLRIRPNDSNPNTVLCLTSPSATATPAYVVFRTCDSTPSQQFTRFYNTGTYSSSYTFVASDGRCLSVGDPQTPLNDGVYWSTIVLATCSGGPEQKWNAPPTALDPRVSRQLETTAGA